MEFSYIAFPHINTSISFFRGVTVSRDNYEVVIEPNLIVPSPCCVEILGKYTQPVFVLYKGDFEEVPIVFKPFGVNQFLPCDLIKYVSKYSQPFSAKNWLQFAPGLFREQNETKRIEALEEFLLANFQEIENETISKTLELLANADMDYSIETIASICSMNVKTFQRQFLKHITCTPSEYKRIARFRFALQTKVLSREIKRLRIFLMKAIIMTNPILYGSLKN